MFSRYCNMYIRLLSFCACNNKKHHSQLFFMFLTLLATKMKSPSLVTVCIALSAALLLLNGQPSVAVVVNCDPSELRVCAGAIMWSMSPSTKCCAKLKEQQPCFCKYMADPDLSVYIKSENAKKVEETCRVSLPKICLDGSEDNGSSAEI